MLEILYEDPDILVCRKPAGVESQSSKSFAPDMVSLIRNHLSTAAGSTGKSYPHYVGVIHRLDKPVEGIMVYGKNEKATKDLSYQLQQHQIEKKYYALLCGKPVDNDGELVDYLWKDVGKNISRRVSGPQKGAKKGILKYRILDSQEMEGQLLSLAEIQLITGRHHQIRVQMSGMGNPLWGDFKYNPLFAGGSEKGTLALSAFYLAFRHPRTKKQMTFRTTPSHQLISKFLIHE